MSSSINSLFCSIGSKDTCITDTALRDHVTKFLDAFGTDKDDVLLLPPDYTRFHSQAGKISQIVAEYYGIIPSAVGSKDAPSPPMKPSQFQILPALGTHLPMTDKQIESMFGKGLAALSSPSPFLVHDWRNDVVTIGHAPASMVEAATDGQVKGHDWPAQLNRVVWEKKNVQNHLILSIGQVVPHEVMGMANFNKNLFVGVGGVEAINLSHFIGAVHGMERMMGRADNRLRRILHYASDKYLHPNLNLWYILTVMGVNSTTGELEMKGLYIGNDVECYNRACELSLQVNFTLLDRPPKTMVTYLDPDEFHSTWLGNKAIYRTRMAIADDGHLIVLAPGVQKFGEDDQVDVLIRRFGYRGTPTTLQAMKDSTELQENLSAVAHLIHGSSEGRFKITYCTQRLTKEEVEQVGFEYAPLQRMLERYPIGSLKDGWNVVDGDEFYYISNPALGLWAVPERFEPSEVSSSQDASHPSKLSGTQKAVDGSGGVGGWAKPRTQP